mgnify:CR=1 FL=1|tara:strand:- start:3388 stop:3552 length:165 start_codon:yes stop_codon:yes gene_type:complete
MKVEILKAATADGVAYRKGACPDLLASTAEKLIARGYAAVWSPKESDDAPAVSE